MWSGLSRLTPSQHVGNRREVMIPYGHGFAGNPTVSCSRDPGLSIHVYVSWRKRAA
jgi:hypothetical protein